MSLPEVLANLRKRPGMYVYPVTYDTAVAFVDGYDAATQRGLLVGFREWLIVKLDGGSNLVWSALVRDRHAMFNSGERTQEPG